MTDMVVKNYHGCTVTVTKSTIETPYPWTFTVEHNGIMHRYGGIPNHCETHLSALRRGWWRAKWLSDGTYDEHYTKTL